MLDGLLRIAEVAERTGLTVGTLYNYVSEGIAPTPRARVGTVALFAPDDIDFFIEVHKGRPGGRKSVKTKRQRRQ